MRYCFLVLFLGLFLTMPTQAATDQPLSVMANNLSVTHIKSLLDKNEDDVHAIAISQDGKFMATGSDNAISIWDCSDWHLIKKLDTKKEIKFLAFSRDSKYLVSSGEKYADLWVTSSWTLTRTVPPVVQESGNKYKLGEITSIVFFPDNTKVAISTANKGIYIWDILSDKKPVKLAGFPESSYPLDDEAFTIDVSPDGKYLAIGTKKGDIKMWDMNLGTVLKKHMFAHFDSVIAIRFTPDGKHLVSAGEDKFVIVWDHSGTGKKVRIMNDHSNDIISILFSNDRMLSVDGDASEKEVCSIFSYDLQNWTLSSKTKSDCTLKNVAISSNFDKLIGVGKNINIYNLSTIQPKSLNSTGERNETK